MVVLLRIKDPRAIRLFLVRGKEVYCDAQLDIIYIIITQYTNNKAVYYCLLKFNSNLKVCFKLNFLLKVPM